MLAALMCNAAFWIGIIQPADLLDMALLLTRHKADFPERGQALEARKKGVMF